MWQTFIGVFGFYRVLSEWRGIKLVCVCVCVQKLQNSYYVEIEVPSKAMIHLLCSMYQQRRSCRGHPKLPTVTHLCIAIG